MPRLSLRRNLFSHGNNKTHILALEEKIMSKRVTIIVLLLLSAWGVQSQTAEEVDTSRIHVRVSTGMAFMNGFGQNRSLQWIAPRFELKPNDRLTVVSGFALAGNLLPQGVRKVDYNLDLTSQIYGTQMTALWAAARYQVSDQLAVWGGVAHASGYFQPLWYNESLPTQPTAVSGGLEWAMPNGGLLEFHFNIVRDPYGTFIPDPYMNGFGYGMFDTGWGMYSGDWPW